MTEQSSRLAPRRFVPFQGCVNFRDLGGYPTGDGRTVSWNKLYRSDALNELTEEDVARAVGELGIQTMVDLRNHDEVRRDGAGVLADSGPDYHHFPLLEKRGEIPPIGGADVAERLAVTYQWIIENSGGLIAEAVTTIARNKGRAAVFHCSAGKDRTGIIAAMVLGVLGVDREIVMADYLLTNEVVVDIAGRITRMQPQSNFNAETLRAQPLAMERVLTTVHCAYGGPEEYLRRHGVPGPVLQSLRTGLLDP